MSVFCALDSTSQWANIPCPEMMIQWVKMGASLSNLICFIGMWDFFLSFSCFGIQLPFFVSTLKDTGHTYLEVFSQLATW
jgi:hypothetical protein